MKSTRFRKPDILFFRFMITYVLLLTVPLSIGMISYVQTLREVEVAAIDTSLSLLQHSKALVSQRLAEVESIAEQLAESSAGKRVLSLAQPYEGKNTYVVRQAISGLPDFTLTNTNIIDHFIYARIPNLVMRQNAVYYAPEFRESVYYLDKTWDQTAPELFSTYQSWKRYLPAERMQINQRKYEAVTYIRSLGSPNWYTGFVVLFIDSALFEGVLDTVNHSDQGWAFLLDEAGGLLAQRCSPEIEAGREHIRSLSASMTEQSGYFPTVLNGRSFMATYYISPDNGWQYVSLQPDEVVLQQVTKIRDTILSFLVIALLAGFVIAYAMAYHNAKPLRSILVAIGDYRGDRGGGKKTYRHVQNSVDALIMDQNALKEQVRAQQPYLRSAFLRRLLNGYLTEAPEIDALARQTGLDLRADFYCVAVARFHQYEVTPSTDMVDRLIAAKMLLQRAVEGCAGGMKVHFLDTGGSRTTCLFLASGQDAPVGDTIAGLVSRADAAARERDAGPAWGIGSVQTSIPDIPRSYYEADYLAGLPPRHSGKHIRHGSRQTGLDQVYYYPDEMKYKLRSFAQQGNYEGIREVFKRLYWDNFHERSLGDGSRKILLFEMLGTLYKACASLAPEDQPCREAVDGIVLRLEQGDDFDGIYLRMLSVYATLCERKTAALQSGGGRLAADVESYIREHFAEESLSLGRVANRFSLSEAYLSQYLKENAGFNFFSFVEALRMAKARELLTTTRDSVKAIASACGYSSDTSFCRAFKRVVGVSASQYRKAESKSFRR